MISALLVKGQRGTGMFRTQRAFQIVFTVCSRAGAEVTSFLPTPLAPNNLPLAE